MQSTYPDWIEFHFASRTTSESLVRYSMTEYKLYMYQVCFVRCFNSRVEPVYLRLHHRPVYGIKTSGVRSGVFKHPHPRNSEVLTKMSRISPVENT
jgi:hypothetical protein